MIDHLMGEENVSEKAPKMILLTEYWAGELKSSVSARKP